MKGIIKERREDLPGHLYRFICISRIQNDVIRRALLVATFPVFFAFNCLACIPLIVISFTWNNIKLVETILKRWEAPAEVKK